MKRSEMKVVNKTFGDSDILWKIKVIACENSKFIALFSAEKHMRNFQIMEKISYETRR